MGRERAEAIARDLGLEPHAGDWAPEPPQQQFLELDCFEAMYGGAAGGGKTDALLVDALSYVGQGYGSKYIALVLRRTWPELEKSAVRRAYELFPLLGGVDREGGKEWIFPGGETIFLDHCQHRTDVHRYQGAAIPRIYFDELTTFDEYQYLYMFSRARSAAGVPCAVRSGSNPGGVGHVWVRKRFGAWVSRKHVRPARPGEIRHYVRRNDVDTEVEPGTRGALGRSFIPAKLEDNPTLANGDPGYRTRLEALPLLEQKQLLGGDWDAEPACRDYYDRALVRVLPIRPHADDILGIARAWDFASSPTGDFTVGVLGAWLRSGIFVVLHVVRFQGRPDKLYTEFERWGNLDLEYDRRIEQCIPTDPGAAGDIVVHDFQRRFPQFTIRARRRTGDKRTYFKPVSSRVLTAAFAVVDDGSWDVDAYHGELEAFPLGVNDDQVDGTSDSYACATGTMPADFTEEAAAEWEKFRRREDRDD